MAGAFLVRGSWGGGLLFEGGLVEAQKKGPEKAPLECDVRCEETVMGDTTARILLIEMVNGVNK